MLRVSNSTIWHSGFSSICICWAWNSSQQRPLSTLWGLPVKFPKPKPEEGESPPPTPTPNECCKHLLESICHSFVLFFQPSFCCSVNNIYLELQVFLYTHPFANRHAGVPAIPKGREKGVVKQFLLPLTSLKIHIGWCLEESFDGYFLVMHSECRTTDLVLSMPQVWKLAGENDQSFL